ncbi:MAG: pyridine nucleotide-disulfide oxidoreductase, partial [Thermodesulfobacteriota bacterium]
MKSSRSGESQPSHSGNDLLIQQLKMLFNGITRDIPIFMFSDRSRSDIFSKANREIIRTFRELSDKIKFREFDLTDELAKKWSVQYSPTLLIDPERYSIRWLGAPMGEEGRTFLETLILVGTGQHHLSEASQKILQKIDAPRAVKVFVSATCPYCPQQG